MLLPSADNAELRALLEEVRPVIAARLDHARSLQRQVAVANWKTSTPLRCEPFDPVPGRV